MVRDDDDEIGDNLENALKITPEQQRFIRGYQQIKEQTKTPAVKLARLLIYLSNFGAKNLKGIKIKNPAFYQEKSLAKTLEEVNLVLRGNSKNPREYLGKTVYHPDKENFDYFPYPQRKV